MFDVLMPLKNLAAAKDRLSSLLTSHQRGTLAVAMATDVLETVLEWSACRSITLIVGAGWEQTFADRQRVTVVHEFSLPGKGLNQLLECGLTRLQSAHKIILHGDLPLLTMNDLDMIASALEGNDLAICPDYRQTGTNAIGFSCDQFFPLQFGEDSFSRHCADASLRGLRWVSVQSETLSADVDLPDDLQSLEDRYLEGGGFGANMRRWIDRNIPFSAAENRTLLEPSLPASASGV